VPRATRSPARAAAGRLRWATTWYGGRAVRNTTRFARVGPTCLIVGAKKAGTSSLFKYLAQHPDVVGSPKKELHYFSRNHARGELWYRSFFPLAATISLARRRLGVEPPIIEASPSYLYHPLAPQRAHAFDPGLKLIAILRDPIDRAYSDYWHVRKRGRLEGLEDTFEEAIEREPELLAGELERLAAEPEYDSLLYRRHAFLARGRYAEQLERWLEHFPAEQLLVLSTSDLGDEPASTVATAVGFLGLQSSAPPVKEYERYHAGSYPPLSPETRDRLAVYFEEPNRRLYELLGRDLGWTRPMRPASAERRA
jgi:sulfotransferase family protein